MGLEAFHLNREAQLWFYKVKQEIAYIDWQTFADQCHLRFGPFTNLKPPRRLTNLRQM